MFEVSRALVSVRTHARLAFSVSGGILALAIVGIVTWWALRPEARLLRLLTHLPEPVVAVRIEPTRESADPLSLLLAQRFSRDLPGVPQDVQPRAWLYVEDGDILQPVLLAFPGGDRRRLSAGIPWHGTLLFGGSAIVDRIVRAPLTAGSPEGTPLRELLSTEDFPEKLLIRQRTLARLHPLLADLDGPWWDVLVWSGAGDRVGFRFSHQGIPLWLTRAEQRVPASLSPPLVVVDGLPANLLFPGDLPPVLRALLASSGVAEELQRLRTFLDERPVGVVISDSQGRLAPLLIADVPAGEESAAREIITALFVKRLRELHATAEGVSGTHGERIRHRRPAPGMSFLETEERDGALFLRAPCAGIALGDRASGAVLPSVCRPSPRPSLPGAASSGSPEPVPPDLVALVGGRALVLGTFSAAVEETFRALRETEDRAQGLPGARIVLDLERLRRVPIVDAIRTALPLEHRRVVDGLQSVHVTLTPARTGVAVMGTISFALPPGIL